MRSMQRLIKTCIMMRQVHGFNSFISKQYYQYKHQIIEIDC